MKNSITIILLLFIANFSFSQTFEYQYTGDIGQIYQVAENEFVYGIFNDSLKQFQIFTLDHTLIKTINLIPASAFYITIYNVSKTLFNSDSKYEIAYTWWVSNTSMGTKIINEDGVTLLSQDWAQRIYFFNTNQGSKMILSYFGWQRTVDVYSLYGTILDIQENDQTIGSYLFPNPSVNNVRINYIAPQNQNNLVLSVYSVDNRLVKEQKVSAYSNEIQLDVSDLKSGMYVYRIHNASYSTAINKFIVRK